MHFHIYSTANRITKFSYTAILGKLYHEEIHSFDSLKCPVLPINNSVWFLFIQEIRKGP